MRKIKEKLRNLYSVHDTEDKAIALILAKNSKEAQQIWLDKKNHELTFCNKTHARGIKIKEIQKAFSIRRLSSLLSEKRIEPGRSLLCTKLARYYTT